MSCAGTPVAHVVDAGGAARGTMTVEVILNAMLAPTRQRAA